MVEYVPKLSQHDESTSVDTKLFVYERSACADLSRAQVWKLFSELLAGLAKVSF